MIEAMHIGVRVSLINTVSAALAMIGRDFTRTEAQAKAFQTRLDGFQRSMLRGGLWLGAGFAGIAMFKKPLEAANELNTALLRIRALGYGDATVSQSLRFAQGMDIFGMSLIDKVGIVKDALSVFNDLGHAKIAAPLIAKMVVANQVLYGKERGAEVTAGVMPLLKVAELRGGINDVKKLADQMNWAEKSYISSGGLVNPREYLNAMKAGGIPLKLMSDLALYVKSEPIIQEMGGFRFGTGMNAAYNNLVQGRLPARAVEELLKYKMIRDPQHMVEWTKIGTVRRMKPGALVGQTEFFTDPYAWLTDILLPHLAKKGLKSTDQIAVANQIGAFLTNSRGANLFSTAFLQMPAIKRAMDRVPGADDINKAYGKAPATLQGAEMNLGAQWKDLLTTVGTTMLPNAIGMLNGVAGALKALNGVLTASPGMVKALTYSIVGLSAAAMGRGVWILGAGLLRFVGITTLARLGLGMLGGGLSLLLSPVALVIAGVAAVGFALFQMWKHWDSTKGVIANIKSEFGMFFGWLSDKVKALLGFFGIHIGAKGGPAMKPLAVRGGLASLGPPDHAGMRKYLEATPGPWQRAAPSAHQSASNAPIVIHNHLHLDGKEISRTVTRHQGNDAAAPATGPTRFDGLLSPFQPSMSLSPG
jgi:hypothetical protein